MVKAFTRIKEEVNFDAFEIERMNLVASKDLPIKIIKIDGEIIKVDEKEETVLV